MSSADAETRYVTSGLLRLTRPQLIGTMAGMLLAALLAAAVLPHLFLKREPLRSHTAAADAPAAASIH